MRTLLDQIKSELTIPGDRLPVLAFVIAACVILLPVALLGKGLADVALSIAAATFLLRSIIQRDASWMREPWIAAAIVLWAYITIRGFLSIDPAESGVKALGWIRFIVFGAALQFVLTVSRGVRRALLYSILAMTVFGAADALFQYVVGYDIFGRPKIGNRLTGPLQNPSIAMLLLFVGLPATIFLLKTVAAGLRARKIRWWSIVALGMIFAAIALAGERLALLMSFVILALVLLLLCQSVVKAAAVTAVYIGAVAALFLASPEIRDRQLSTISEVSSGTSSVYTRVMIAGLKVIEDNPVFGVGIKNFKAHCPQSATEAEVGDACHYIHPHQVWLHITAETGLLGAAGFLTVFVLALTPAVRLWRSWMQEPLLAGATIAVLVRLLPFTPSGNFFSNWRESFFWFLLGTSAAMARIMIEEREALRRTQASGDPRPSSAPAAEST
jgi:O-antigen ligase